MLANRLTSQDDTPARTEPITSQATEGSASENEYSPDAQPDAW